MDFQSGGGRSAPMAYKLNKGSDFYDNSGQLKEGYSYAGGEGMVAMGEGRIGTTRGAGKDGIVGGSISKTIYGKMPEQEQAPAPEPVALPEEAPEPEVILPPSDKVTNARDNVSDFEENILGSDGDQLFAQGFKDEYADNLVNDLKAENPAVLDEVKKGIEEKDRLQLGGGLQFS